MKMNKDLMSSIIAGLLLMPTGREGLYLDPGSGSFILQLIVAGAAGAIYMLRGYIRRFWNMIRGKKGASEEENDDGNE